jgi:hypothetical protein
LHNGWHAPLQVSKIEEPKQVNKTRIRKRNGYSHELRLQVDVETERWIAYLAMLRGGREG